MYCVCITVHNKNGIEKNSTNPKMQQVKNRKQSYSILGSKYSPVLACVAHMLRL